MVAHVVVELLLICSVACRALSFVGVVSVTSRHVLAFLVVRPLARELCLLHGSGILLLAILGLHHEVLLRDGMVPWLLVKVSRGCRVTLRLVRIVVHVVRIGALLPRCSCGLR